MLKKLLVVGLFVSCFSEGSVLAYTVQKGDTISGLSKRFGVSQQEIVQENNILNPDIIFVGQNLTLGQSIDGFLGASRNYVEIPDSTLYSGAIVGDTSITLDQLVDIYGNSLVMADFGDKGYGRINPEGNNISESFSFSGITANADGTKTLTGVKHVLAKSPYTETSGITRSHGIGSTVRITNTAGFYNDFANKANNETITGNWTFSTGTIYLGNSPSSALKCVSITNGDANSPKVCFNDTTNKWVAYDDGINSYNLDAAAGGLSASTTKAIGITDSKIHVNASSTLGFGNDANGELYLKDGSNSGIGFDSNGIFVERNDTFNWQGAHKFVSNLNASSTFQSTEPLTVFSTTTSSTLPRIATGYISATTTGANVTTTVTNNLEVNGNIGGTGINLVKSTIATGQASQAINTTGDQVITHGLGVTPSLIVIQAYGIVDGNENNRAESFGTATSTTNETATYISHKSTAGDGTQITGQDNANIISLRDVSDSTEAAASLTGISDTTFTLNWGTNANSGTTRVFQWIAYR